MDTRTGEIISATTAIGVSASTLTSPPDTKVIEVLYQTNTLPEWAVVALLCGLFCLYATFFQNNTKVQALSRFLSGCVWGTIVMVLGAQMQLFPLFWTAVVLFLFDIYTVITKGQSCLNRRSNS